MQRGERPAKRGVAKSLKRTILIADDTEANRYTVGYWLRQAGFAVVEATDGAEALRRAADRPDVIILDVRLPDQSGFEVAYRLKQEPATASIPVIHLSAAFTTGEWRAQGLDAGADAFLTHPVEPAELVATVRALLRVRQAEEEVRAAAEEWQATFNAIADAVCLIDGNGVLLRCNTAATELLHRVNEGHGDRHFDEIFPPPAELAPNAASSVTRTGEPAHYETWIRDRWFAVSVDPVVPRAEDAASAVAVVSDITARRRAEEERAALLARAEAARREAEISRMEAEAARGEAEAASRAKSEFLAVMSHELRTPLNAIDGYAELLELGVRGPITDSQRDDIRRIRRSQKHLLALINDVLNFVRLEAGTVRYHIHTFRLADAIHDVEDVTAPQLHAKRLRFVRNCDDDIRVRADRDKVDQILVNLMTNAIKFTDPDGEIAIECERQGALVALRVRDTGRGIPNEKLSAIFEPFVQIARSAGAPSEGVGLGLAISRDLSRAMGGDIVVESAVGKGSVFTLTLPAAESARESARATVAADD